MCIFMDKTHHVHIFIIFYGQKSNISFHFHFSGSMKHPCGCLLAALSSTVQGLWFGTSITSTVPRYGMLMHWGRGPQCKDHLLRYEDSHYKDQMVLRPSPVRQSYLYNRNPYTCKMASLYRDSSWRKYPTFCTWQFKKKFWSQII